MRITFLLLPFLILLSCISAGKKQETDQNISYQQKDKEILNDILKNFGNDKDSATGSLLIKVGTYFLGTPYVAHTLEMKSERLVINLREMDCTTFAENCLAIVRTIKSNNPGFEQFTKELKNIRYRNGVLDGYPSRLHYFSDWIYNNAQKKLISDISKEIANTIYPLNVNFMSTHPDSYQQLKDNPGFIKTIEKQEKEISGRTMYYIPENKIASVESRLKDGDIAGITTSIKGMDIQHVVILIHRNGSIHILHASSSAEKVVISDNTLEDYLKGSKSATGIMVARPL